MELVLKIIATRVVATLALIHGMCAEIKILLFKERGVNETLTTAVPVLAAWAVPKLEIAVAAAVNAVVFEAVLVFPSSEAFQLPS